MIPAFLGVVSSKTGADMESEAIRSVSTDGGAVAFTYIRDRPTVSIGRFCDMSSVNVQYAETNGIDIFGRKSGGSAIYCDDGQITYSVAFRDGTNDKRRSFERVCNAVILALSDFDISASFKPDNDILVNGKKISGSAGYSSEGCSVQHGSIIIRGNDVTDSVLIPVKKRNYDGLTSMQTVLGYMPDMKSVALDTVKRILESF